MKDRSPRVSSWSRRIATVGLVAGLAFAAAPATAMAATAFVTNATQPDGDVISTARFRAAPGEVNNLRIHERSSERFDFRDSGRTITPGAGCRRLGSTVRCTPRSSRTTTVAPASASTGDLNDQVAVVRGRATVNGGSGNDSLETQAGVKTVLNGSSGNDLLSVDLPGGGTPVGHTLNGNSGNDLINGGESGDRIAGGDGEDTINGLGGDDVADGNGDDDNMAGGTGRDRLLGAFGNDRILGNSGRDRIRGQFGNDRLAGGRNNDRLGGGPNRDRLFGNSGNDLVVGNGGRDRYRAGPGNDRVRAVDGIRERVNCGTGFDRARVDRVPMDVTAFCNVVARELFRR